MPCSPFSLQPSARSPKLRLYETLFLWNHRVDELVALLRSMEKLPFARESALQCGQAGLEEVRADVNADFLEERAEYELDDAGHFWRQRAPYEKEREDPDDVYISTFCTARQNARNRACRHASASSPIQP